MSVPAPSEKYSPPRVPKREGSPKPAAWRATAPGTSILTGISFLSMCMRRSCSGRCGSCPLDAPIVDAVPCSFRATRLPRTP